jgi:hypothetical protein|tara:strand:- start:115 stop:282 length:168 start_codon:yes stop_codon:yes gene_type:complete
MNKETKTLLKDIRFTLYQYEDGIIDSDGLRDTLTQILNINIKKMSSKFAQESKKN